VDEQWRVTWFPHEPPYGQKTCTGSEALARRVYGEQKALGTAPFLERREFTPWKTVENSVEGEQP
jgi:hypothetical protein